MKANYMLRSGIVLGASLLSFSATAADKAPVPILPDTYATVVIGDVNGLIQKAGDLASKVMPGISADVLKQQAGAMLGDPGLEGFPAGSGIAVIVPNKGMPVAFLEVSAKKIADYEKLASARGAAGVKQAEGLLIAGATAESVSAASAFASKVKTDVLGGSGNAGLAGAVKVSELIRKYEPQVREAAASMSAKMKDAMPDSNASAKAPMDAAVNMYLGFGKKLETLEVGLSPASSGLSIDYVITPLAKTEATPAAATAGKTGTDMLKLVPASGAMRGYIDFNPQSMAKWMGEIMTSMSSETTAPKVDTAAFSKWLNEGIGSLAGSGAFAMGVETTGSLSGAYVMSVTDEAAALKFVAGIPDAMKSSGMTKFYADLGLPMKVSYQEKTREYKGISIHRLNMALDTSKQPEADQKQMAAFANMNYDVATVDKVLIYAVQPTKVETLIDAVKSGSHPGAKGLTSSSTLPTGGRMYMDYNLGEIMKLGMQGTNNAAAASAIGKMADVLQDAPPLQIGGYVEGSRMRLTTLIPTEMIKALVQSGQQPASAPRPQAEKDKPDEKVETN